jgi:TonB family protein
MSRHRSVSVLVALLLVTPVLPAAAGKNDKADDLESLEKCCQKQDGEACLHLAEAYIFGDGIARRPEKAVAFLESACFGVPQEKGCGIFPMVPLSCRRLAQMYDRGEKPVAADWARAAGFYWRASENGDAVASAALSRLHATGGPNLAKNVKQSRLHAMKACGQKGLLTRSCGATDQQVAEYESAVDEACRARPAPVEDVTPPPADAAIFFGGTFSEPRKIKNVDPVFPADVRRDHSGGLVVLEATISREGIVTELLPLGSTDPRMEKAAIQAVKQWVYTPTLRGGKPVPTTMTITVTFRLER